MVQDHISARLWGEHGHAFARDADALARDGAASLATAIRRATDALLALASSVLMLGLAVVPALPPRDARPALTSTGGVATPWHAAQCLCIRSLQ